MREKIEKTLLLAYAICAVIAYGHFVNNGFCNEKNNDIPNKGECVVMAGPFVALAWPLYLSAELQK